MMKQPVKLGVGVRPLEQSKLWPVLKARGAQGDGAEGPASQALTKFKGRPYPPLPVSVRLVLVNFPCP